MADTPPRILVAEDNDNQREGLRALLKAHGFEVETAADGQEALEKLERESFDLLLTDIWMPRLDGLALTARIRENGALQRQAPRVVVITGDDTAGTMLEALRAQALRYIAKPFKPAELVSMIRAALAEAQSMEIQVVSAAPHWVELLVPCQPQMVERIEGFLMRLKSDLPDDARAGIARAFRELLKNAIEWGGEMDPNQQVRIGLLRTPRVLVYHIADPGKGFRMEETLHAAVNNPPEHPLEHRRVRKQLGMRPGGMGILVAATTADEILYNEAQNEVVLVKYLAGAPGGDSSESE